MLMAVITTSSNLKVRSLARSRPPPDKRTNAYDMVLTGTIYDIEAGIEPFNPDAYGLLEGVQVVCMRSPSWSPDGGRLAWMMATFVVRAGDEPIYAGVFWTPVSSLSYDGVIILQPFSKDETSIGLSLGYPSPTAFAEEDPRLDRWIIEALDRAGKLKQKYRPR